MNYLVTAIGSLSAEAVITALRTMPGVRIIGSSCHPAEWTATSNMVDAFKQIPPASDSAAFLAAIRRLCKAEAIDRIIPLTDPEVDTLNEFRDAFEENTAMLCIPGKAATSICRDKWRVFKSFEHDTTVTPLPTWLLDGNQWPEEASYPLIAKPRTGRSSEGIVLIEDTADCLHLQRKLRGKNYIVQPKLAGDICVVDTVRHGALKMCSTMARKELLRTPNGAGLTVRMLPTGELNRMAHHIAERLDVNGCINIEFLVHDERAMLMDINPRFSAGVAFSKMAGYDMVGNHLKCFEASPIDQEIKPHPAIYTRRYTESLTAMLGN